VPGLQGRTQRAGCGPLLRLAPCARPRLASAGPRPRRRGAISWGWV